jgi:hypothetical protein
MRHRGDQCKLLTVQGWLLIASEGDAIKKQLTNLDQ